MKRLIYLPLVILVFLGGFLAGMHLGSRHQESAKPQESGVTEGAARQEANQGRGGILPGPGATSPGSAAPAPYLDPQAAQKMAEQRKLLSKPSLRINLTPENLDETAAALRQSGIPEEDIQGILEGARSRVSPEEEGPYPTLHDLPLEERAAEIRNNLKDSGIPPEDIEAIAEGLSQRIESLKQSPPRMSPLPAPAPPK